MLIGIVQSLSSACDPSAPEPSSAYLGNLEHMAVLVQGHIVHTATQLLADPLQVGAQLRLCCLDGCLGLVNSAAGALQQAFESENRICGIKSLTTASQQLLVWRCQVRGSRVALSCLAGCLGLVNSAAGAQRQSCALKARNLLSCSVC